MASKVKEITTNLNDGMIWLLGKNWRSTVASFAAAAFNLMAQGWSTKAALESAALATMGLVTKDVWTHSTVDEVTKATVESQLPPSPSALSAPVLPVPGVPQTPPKP